MKKIFVLIAALTILTQTSVAQTRREDLDAEIKAIIKARDELMRSLLEDDSFSNFDKRFNDLIKKFDDESFGGSMQGLQMGAVVGEYDWRETETHQILAVKVKQIKDRPLDIKIEKGFVRLKGDVEEVLDYPSRKGGKKISKVHFERSFSIPDGVDQTNPEFENKDGELLIKFKKIKPAKSAQPKKNSVKKQNQNQDSDREPVERDSEDSMI